MSGRCGLSGSRRDTLFERLLADDDAVFVGIQPVARAKRDACKRDHDIAFTRAEFSRLRRANAKCAHRDRHLTQIFDVTDSAIDDYACPTVALQQTTEYVAEQRAFQRAATIDDHDPTLARLAQSALEQGVVLKTMDRGDGAVKLQLLTEVAEHTAGGSDFVAVVVGEITDAAYHVWSEPSVLSRSGHYAAAVWESFMILVPSRSYGTTDLAQA